MTIFRTAQHLMLCMNLGLALASCGSDAQRETPEGVLTVWAHSGQESERDTLQQHVARFNDKQDDIQVDLTFLPGGSYNAQIQAAALAGELPDILEFDGPYLYNYVWQGHLLPLDDLMPSGLRERLLPSIIEQGTFRGKLYSLGMFDSGLGIFAARSALKEVDVRIPSGPADAWSLAEFEDALAALAANDPDGRVLDLKLNYTGEWYPYAFSPALLSAGAGLVSRGEERNAEGVLNNPAAVRVMLHFQEWLGPAEYVDSNVDDAAFVQGRTPLSWVGHWEYPRYSEALGEDLILVPLPDFGEGMRTGQGSWNWGITRYCEAPEDAMAFLAFLMEDAQVLEMSNANGAVPATYAAVEASPLYRQDGPLHLYAEQLTEGYAVPRPRTPAYPIISSIFQQAFNDIRNGADVQWVLDEAAKALDRDFRDNQGYPSVPVEEME